LKQFGTSAEIGNKWKLQ